MPLRLGVAILAVTALCGPAAAAGALRIGGAFGNAEGCDFYLSGVLAGEEPAVITPYTFTSPKTRCVFDALTTRTSERFELSASCTFGGVASVEADRVTVTGNARFGYVVRVGDTQWGPLLECAGTDELFAPPGTQV